MNRIAPLALALMLAIGCASFAETVAPGTRVIVPFELVGTRAQYHLIAWFSGHPDYESVEAFAYGNGKIRAILTRHGGAQIDAFNYERPDVSSGRDWYASPIAFELSKDGMNARLEMKTPDGEALALAYAGAAKPSARYGGLADPGNHSPGTGLPAMWRKASAVSGPGSTVTIGGRTYGIPMDREISRPPFFTAYSAFLSEDFESLFVRAYGLRPVTALDRPGNPTGNSQAKAEGIVRLSYTTGVSANVVALAGSGADSGIASIVSATGELARDGNPKADGGCELRFDPPLEDLASVRDGEGSTSRFSILFDGGRARAIEGTATVAREKGTLTVILRPEKPDGLRGSRSIRYEIDLSGDEPVGSATVIGADGKSAP